MPANIIFGSWNTFVTILPQPTILSSGIFVFFTNLYIFSYPYIFANFYTLSKLIGFPFKFVIVCVSVHQIPMPQLN